MHSDLDVKLVMGKTHGQKLHPMKWLQQPVTRLLRDGVQTRWTVRAEEHLAHAIENVDQALTIANECVPEIMMGMVFWIILINVQRS